MRFVKSDANNADGLVYVNWSGGMPCGAAPMRLAGLRNLCTERASRPCGGYQWTSSAGYCYQSGDCYSGTTDRFITKKAI